MSIIKKSSRRYKSIVKELLIHTCTHVCRNKPGWQRIFDINFIPLNASKHIKILHCQTKGFTVTLYVCVCMCAYERAYVRIWACMCVYMYMYMCVYARQEMTLLNYLSFPSAHINNYTNIQLTYSYMQKQHFACEHYLQSQFINMEIKSMSLRSKW